MNNKNKCNITYYESMKCIWMASQVVEYKLCDNNFDCENCQFDKVMRNYLDVKTVKPNEITNIANRISSNLNNIKYDDQIIYLKNNLIAKQLCPNTFYFGINPIFISFLDSISSMTISECNKSLITGQDIIQISGIWGSVNFSAPMNFLIYDVLGDPTYDLLKSQWVAIIGIADQEISNGKLYQEEWRNLHHNAINIIEDIKANAPQVGNTMMDGGTQIEFLHQLVGKKRYLDILNSLIK
jgi:hypothetical protein